MKESLFLDFEILDARIASALRKIISRTSFRIRVSVEEQRAQKCNRFLRGRQIASIISCHFQSIGAFDAVQGLSDLFSMCLQDDDVQDLDTRWDQIFLGTSEMLSENVFEGLHKRNCKIPNHFKQCLQLYSQELSRDDVTLSCQRLRTMVRQHVDQDTQFQSQE